MNCKNTFEKISNEYVPMKLVVDMQAILLQKIPRLEIPVLPVDETN